MSEKPAKSVEGILREFRTSVIEAGEMLNRKEFKNLVELRKYEAVKLDQAVHEIEGLQQQSLRDFAGRVVQKVGKSKLSEVYSSDDANYNLALQRAIEIINKELSALKKV